MLLKTLLKKLFCYTTINSQDDDSILGGSSRRTHFLGKKEQVSESQGSKQDTPARPPVRYRYRDLSDLSLGEVEDALTAFGNQLVISPAEGWVAKNYFCHVPLRIKRERATPVVFGRVKSVYPSSGNFLNIEGMELYFPKHNQSPDLLYIGRNDISPQKPVESYLMGIKMYLSQSEMDDFSYSEYIFYEKGFAPVYETGYLDILEIDKQDPASLPWIYVVGSEWYSSIPDSVRPEIREQLLRVALQGGRIFNYHPDWLKAEINTLNKVLGFKPGFTGTFMIEPSNIIETVQIVSETFNKMFQLPIDLMIPSNESSYASFLELKLGVEPKDLTPKFLDALRTNISKIVHVSPNSISFLGYRPGSTYLLTGIDGKQKAFHEEYQDLLQFSDIEEIRPWEQIPEKLTFISCSDYDLASGREILDYLLREKFEPWLEQESIFSGEKIGRAIMRAFEKSTAFIYCFSKSSNSDQRLQRWEVVHALDRADNEYKDGIYFLPVRIGPCIVPDLILDFKLLDWNESSKEHLILALWEGLRRRMNIQ